MSAIHVTARTMLFAAGRPSNFQTTVMAMEGRFSKMSTSRTSISHAAGRVVTATDTGIEVEAEDTPSSSSLVEVTDKFTISADSQDTMTGTAVSTAMDHLISALTAVILDRTRPGSCHTVVTHLS